MSKILYKVCPGVTQMHATVFKVKNKKETHSYDTTDPNMIAVIYDNEPLAEATKHIEHFIAVRWLQEHEHLNQQSFKTLHDAINKIESVIGAELIT